MNKYFLVLAALLFGGSCYATPIKFESSAQKTTVIELFTSQGCSRCPSAERWLNKLTEHPKLWKQFVPMAFHVDYWDRLGWKDVYAKPEHSARQYQYQRQGNTRVVYTPGFFANCRV